MLRCKRGVSLKKVTPQMVVALLVAEQEFSREGVECWITSGDDSTHREGSLHYEGNALDFRTYHLDAIYDVATFEQRDQAKQRLAARIQDRLADGYRVAFEPTVAGGRTEHLHIEYRG